MRRLALAILAGALMTSPVSAQTHKGYEMPPHTVERQDGAFELRRYGANVLAEVRVQGDRSQAANQGFRALAGHIFSGNAASDKIAMTVPVTQEPKGDGLWRVRFMMPSAYDLAELPKPNNAAIRLFRQPLSRQVAVAFSGLRTDATLAAQETALRQWEQA